MAKEKTETAEQPQLDAEQARKLLQEQTQKRIEACQSAVNQVLKQHNCHMEPHLVMTQQGNQFGLRVVPNAENQ